MAKITAEEQKQFENLPADTVIRVRVEEMKVTDEEGKYGAWQKLNAKFTVTGVPQNQNLDDFVGKPIWGSIPFKLTDSADNQLKQWVEALLGIEISVGFELDTENLLNRECRAIVGHYTKKNGMIGQQVSGLLPLVGGNGSTVDAAPAVAQEDANLAAWQAGSTPTTPAPVAAPVGGDPWAATSSTLDDPGF